MLQISNIQKSFNKQLVLNDISIDILPQSIYCLLGKNGVGKSTLLNIVTQTISQDSGEIIVNDKVFNPNVVLVKEKIGFVGEQDYLINELTGFQYLQFHGLVFKIPSIELKERISSLVHYFFDNENDMLKKIASYSSGMRIKMRTISALLHKPEILILDEPFANLDPLAVEKLIILLKEYITNFNHLVLISSHDLMYVDKIATHIGVLDNTKLVFNGTKKEFTQQGTKHIDQTLLEMIRTEKVSTENLNWLL